MLSVDGNVFSNFYNTFILDFIMDWYVLMPMVLPEFFV